MSTTAQMLLVKPPALACLPAAAKALKGVIETLPAGHGLEGWISGAVAGSKLSELLAGQITMMYLLLDARWLAAAQHFAEQAQVEGVEPWVAGCQTAAVAFSVLERAQPWVGLELDLMVESLAAVPGLVLGRTVAKEQLLGQWLIEMIWRGFGALKVCCASASDDELEALRAFQEKALGLLRLRRTPH
jgi:L-lactate permease